METHAPTRLALKGVFDRTLVEEAALHVAELAEDGAPGVTLDLSAVSEVLMDGMLMLRERPSLCACRFENAPIALSRYARLLELELDFVAPAAESAPVIREKPGLIVNCRVCGRSMRVERGGHANFACPHCSHPFAVDPQTGEVRSILESSR